MKIMKIIILLNMLIAGSIFGAVNVGESGQNRMNINGKLQEPAWRNIRIYITGFHIVGENNEISKDTKVKICHDKKWLYFAVECINHSAGYDLNTEKNHDGNVARDDSLEIFITPDKSKGSYYQFVVNCDNIKMEQKVYGKAAGSRDKTWSTTWLSNTSKNENGWTAEVAIPLSILAKNGKIGTLSFNVYRNKIIPELDTQGVRMGEKTEYSSLFPVRKSFHEIESFQELKGLENFKFEEPTMLNLDDYSVSNYYVKNGKIFYDVMVKASHKGKAPYNWAEVTIVDLAKDGKKNEVSVKKYVVPNQQRRIEVSVPVKRIEERTAWLLFKDQRSRGVIRKLPLLELSRLSPLQAYFVRNYYTSEQYAELFCSLSLPKETMNGAKLLLKNKQNKIIFSADKVVPENLFKLTLDKFPIGYQNLKLEYADRNGTVLYSKNLELITRLPKPGLEWKIDRRRKVVLNNGKPFFPFGSVLTDFREEDVKAVKGMGFNMFAKWISHSDRKNQDKAVKLAQKYGLYVVDMMESYCRKMKAPAIAKYFKGEDLKKHDIIYKDTVVLHGHLQFKKVFTSLTRAQRNEIFDSYYKLNVKYFTDAVNSVKNNPSLIGYDLFDEPFFATFDQFVQGRHLYKRINKIDGYHPSMTLYSSYIPEGKEATDWCDILATDPYWVPEGTLKGRSDINFVSKIVAYTKKRADLANKVTWIMPFDDYWSGVHKRLISPEEQICQTYLALIHGAKGIIYFSYPIRYSGIADAFRKLSKQIEVLSPAICAEDVKQNISYQPTPFEPEKGKYPLVQIRLMKDDGNEMIMLAANSSDRNVNVNYKSSSINAKYRISRIFKKKEYTVSNNKFTDKIEPFGVRAYKLGKIKSDNPIDISVNSKYDGKCPARKKEKIIDYCGRIDQKNLIPNPGFERSTLKNLPDYYRPNGKTFISTESGKGDIEIVEKDPYEGKYCLEIRNKKDGRKIDFTGVGFYCSPQLRKPEMYTWSLYMKGSKNGIKVIFGSHHLKYWNGKKWVFSFKTLPVTTEWKRYYVSGPINPNTPRGTNFEIQLRGEGKLWVDAMQLEKGSKPTDYEK